MTNTLKNTLVGFPLIAALIGSSFAGEQEQSIAISPAGQAHDWSWFAGGSVGYVTGEYESGPIADTLGLEDWDEPIYTLHIGRERRNAGEDFSHAFFLEIGYTENDESASYDLGESLIVSFDTDVEIIPITMNYKFEAQGGGKFTWYMGGGLGLAMLDVDLDASATGVGAVSDSDSDTVFFGQVFAGVTYNVSETLELYGGLRYIFMDDVDVELYDGLIDESTDSPLDGAIHYEVGLRYNF